MAHLRWAGSGNVFSSCFHILRRALPTWAHGLTPSCTVCITRIPIPSGIPIRLTSHQISLPWCGVHGTSTSTLTGGVCRWRSDLQKTYQTGSGLIGGAIPRFRGCCGESPTLPFFCCFPAACGGSCYFPSSLPWVPSTGLWSIGLRINTVTSISGLKTLHATCWWLTYWCSASLITTITINILLRLTSVGAGTRSIRYTLLSSYWSGYGLSISRRQACQLRRFVQTIRQIKFNNEEVWHHPILEGKAGIRSYYLLKPKKNNFLYSSLLSSLGLLDCNDTAKITALWGRMSGRNSSL